MANLKFRDVIKFVVFEEDSSNSKIKKYYLNVDMYFHGKHLGRVMFGKRGGFDVEDYSYLWSKRDIMADLLGLSSNDLVYLAGEHLRGLGHKVNIRA